MTLWTQKNALDFTSRELDTINACQDALEIEFSDMGRGQIATILMNAWVPDADVLDLVTSVGDRIRRAL